MAKLNILVYFISYAGIPILISIKTSWFLFEGIFRARVTFLQFWRRSGRRLLHCICSQRWSSRARCVASLPTTASSQKVRPALSHLRLPNAVKPENGKSLQGVKNAEQILKY
jgi:hypothetical protein